MMMSSIKRRRRSLRSNAPNHVDLDDLLLDALPNLGNVEENDPISLLRLTKRGASKDVVMKACNKNGLALRYASKEMRDDKEVVLLACKNDGQALQFASTALRADKHVIFVACKQNGEALQWAWGLNRNDKELVLMAVCQKGVGRRKRGNDRSSRSNGALQWAPNELRGDKEVVLAACRQNGRTFEYASEALKKNKDFVMDICKHDSRAYQYASVSLQMDKEVVLNLCRHHGLAIRLIPNIFRYDIAVVLAACSQNGEALQFASEQQRGDKRVVLVACAQNGEALRYASEELRALKQIVLVAAASNPNALKYALGGLNQNKDCLISAKLWDENYQSCHPPPQKKAKLISKEVAGNNKNGGVSKKIVLSTRFALAPNSPSKATQFTVLLKEHKFIRNGNFVVYSPNAFAKGTCDEKWTRYDWPCRGTDQTCGKVSLFEYGDNDNDNDNSGIATGVPKPDCCWRYSFRYQLEEAKRTNGFMLQLVEDMRRKKHEKVWQILGDGQIIENEMAQEVGTKVFRVYTPVLAKANQEYEEDFKNHHIESVIAMFRDWYECNCNDMEDSTFTPITDIQ